MQVKRFPHTLVIQLFTDYGANRINTIYQQRKAAHTIFRLLGWTYTKRKWRRGSREVSYLSLRMILPELLALMRAFNAPKDLLTLVPEVTTHYLLGKKSSFLTLNLTDAVAGMVGRLYFELPPQVNIHLRAD